MMDKSSLTKLIDFVIEISQLKENEWFREALISKLEISTSPKIKDNLEVNELLNDLKRSKSFLRTIDRNIWKEGIKYYSIIKFTDLKLELIQDYKEMKIADKNDDIIEFTRRLVMQLENCLNAICLIKNAHDFIKSSPNTFRNSNSDLLKGEYSFFNSDGTPKQLSKISIHSKIFFAKQLYDIKYSYSDMSQMITIRNKSSHRGENTEREKEIIEFAKNNIAEKKANYFVCYDIFWKKMDDLLK